MRGTKNALSFNKKEGLCEWKTHTRLNRAQKTTANQTTNVMKMVSQIAISAQAVKNMLHFVPNVANQIAVARVNYE
jgi:hypothetical protein